MILRRLSRAALIALLLSATITSAALAAAPSPHSPAVVVPTTANALTERYADVRADVIAWSTDEGQRPERAAALRALARPGSQLLHVDATGDRRVVEVFGDLAQAERIAVLVPGADTRLETYDGRDGLPGAALREAAENLQAEAARRRPDSTLAVVAWLGYGTPAGISLGAVTDGAAQAAAPALGEFVRDLADVNDASVVLLCHSYGSLVCAHAHDAPAVSDVVLYGSPGVPTRHASDITSAARVWAGRGAADWLRHLPRVGLAVGDHFLGFGTDPVTPRFGAAAFDAGDADHSGYFVPGSTSLTNLAAIALGHTTEGDDV